MLLIVMNLVIICGMFMNWSSVGLLILRSVVWFLLVCFGFCLG